MKKNLYLMLHRKGRALQKCPQFKIVNEKKYLILNISFINL